MSVADNLAKAPAGLRTLARIPFTTLDLKRSAKPKRQNNMFYIQRYACARSSESQGAIINADEYSISAQSLISAKEEGGTAHPPALLC